MTCMKQAVAEQGVEEAPALRLEEPLACTADWIRNKPEIARKPLD